MSSEKYPYLHALLSIPGFGSEKIKILMQYFGHDPEKAWHANSTELEKATLSQKLIDSLETFRQKNNPQELWEICKSEDISLITKTNPNFPKGLLDIPSMPYFLYIRGQEKILAQESIAIVGSRKYSPYGNHAATSFASDLAVAGIHIVSGLALGIDAIAHKSTLDAKADGKTIAVLGGGVDDKSLAPQSHTNLAHQILKDGGALISQYPPGTKPSRGTFPARNKIMAAMSDSTLVIEATQNSGTLITAGYAQDFGKDLYAVPGSIFQESSVGTNTLIQEQKATLVRSAHDIIVSRGLTSHKTPTKDFYAESKEESLIYKCLSDHPDGIPIDKIIRETTLEGASTSQTLVMLEIRGIVMHLGGGIYTLTK